MQKSNSNLLTVIGVLGMSSVIACAHNAPKELVDAREAYRRAAVGSAAQLAPAELDTAKTALARAEAMFQDDDSSATMRDYAYVAQRKAQLAEVKAGQESSNRQKISGQEKIQTAMKDKLAETKSDLKHSQQESADAKTDAAAQAAALAAAGKEKELNASKDALQSSKDALEAEKVARAAAEQANKDLTESLAKIAKVTEDERGLVISLSGSVLFASGKSNLLPSASTSLDNVAAALAKRQDQGITIEGHTDSMGSDSTNQMLSDSRAGAVRNYLIGRGVDQARIRAIGLGKSRPVADNATAEGRANNRRVEIILSPNRS